MFILLNSWADLGGGCQGGCYLSPTPPIEIEIDNITNIKKVFLQARANKIGLEQTPPPNKNFHFLIPFEIARSAPAVKNLFEHSEWGLF